MQKFQTKKKTFSGISKSRVGILLYSKIEKKKKKKKENLFSDFQNQGRLDVDNQTIFSFLALCCVSMLHRLFCKVILDNFTLK